MNALPESIARCPRCHATSNSGLNVQQSHCARCGQDFFDLSGLPCWFPSGTEQRALWNHLLAEFVERKQQVDAEYQQAAQPVGRLPSTRARLATLQQVHAHNFATLETVLRELGLKPEKQARFGGLSNKGFSQYLELMLRDWGWAPEPPEHQGQENAAPADEYRAFYDENLAAVEAAQSLLRRADAKDFQRVLVLGAGAGRLSWDLHCALKPQATYGLDINPLLLAVARRMIQNQEILTLCDTRKLPHAGSPEIHQWTLACGEGTDERRRSWHAIAGDAWNAPFRDDAFDLVVTPWLIDITGEDIARITGTVDRLLAPGGYWLNQGPLLYPDELPASRQYGYSEIRDLLQRARFDLSAERFDREPYTYSPLSQRGRYEEVWSFLAQAQPKPATHAAERLTARLPRTHAPDWLLLPHLPVPQVALPEIPASLQNIAQLFDGERSIDDISGIVRGSLPQGHDAHGFVYQFIDEYLFLPE